MIGTDPQSLKTELESICHDGATHSNTAESIQEQAIAITMMQGLMRRTHCFIDGNTRTAACVLLSQIEEVFGKDTGILSKEKVSEIQSSLALAYRGIVAPFTNDLLSNR